MTTVLRIVPLLVLFLFCTASLIQAQTNDRFVQDRFAIGFWVDPPAEHINAERYKEIADANFNFVLGPFGGRTPENVKKQLDLCEQFGMVAIVNGDFRKPETLIEHPALWGYHLVDEPNVEAIPEIRGWVDGIRKHRPGKLAYFNLYPDYASPAQLKAPSYDEYIRRFAVETNCDVLCMDHYPVLKPNVDGRPAYCRNLVVMRKYALQQNIPWWNFFNIMPFGSHQDPTESHVRWQVFTSLVYGAKGVLYFCYWTPRGGEFPKGGAIITAEGHKTRHYGQAKRINAVLKNLGPTIMKLTNENVIFIKSGDDIPALLSGTPIKNITGGGEYLIGIFRHEDGRKAVLLNNYDHNYTAWPTVEFAIDADKVVEIDQESGSERAVRDDSPAMDGLQIGLDAGEGRLFLFPEE